MKSIIKTNQPEVGRGIAIFDPTIPLIGRIIGPKDLGQLVTITHF